MEASSSTNSTRMSSTPKKRKVGSAGKSKMSAQDYLMVELTNGKLQTKC